MGITREPRSFQPPVLRCGSGGSIWPVLQVLEQHRERQYHRAGLVRAWTRVRTLFGLAADVSEYSVSLRCLIISAISARVRTGKLNGGKRRVKIVQVELTDREGQDVIGIHVKDQAICEVKDAIAEEVCMMRLAGQPAMGDELQSAVATCVVMRTPTSCVAACALLWCACPRVAVSLF